MAKKTTSTAKTDGAGDLWVNQESQSEQPTSIQFTVNDIGILYSLSQQASVNVSNVHTISGVMRKVEQFLEQNKG